MAARKRPTHTNVHAAQAMIPAHARRLVRAYTAGLKPLADLATEAEVPPVTAISALAQLHAAEAEIGRLRRELAGVILLGGGSLRMTAAACGVTPGTLSTWGPGTWAAHLGAELVADPAAPDGWRTA